MNLEEKGLKLTQPSLMQQPASFRASDNLYCEGSVIRVMCPVTRMAACDGQVAYNENMFIHGGI